MERLSSSSVLIVDDNSQNLQVLADILRNKKYRVATAKDGKKALNFISKKKPDIILLDVMMPVMDGYKVCQELKNNPDTKDIPVIFISALAEISDKVRGFEVGGVDYITKPFQKEEVHARVETHLKLKFSQEELKTKNTLLKKANATREKLFSIISHDLRGPIGTLSNALDLIADSPFMAEDKKRIFLKELSMNARGIYHLLENLLSWARTQRDQINSFPVNIEVNRIIENCISVLDTIAKNKSITVQSKLNEPIWVYADKDMLITVLRNLISNAIKFTCENGQVTISATDLNDMIEIAISDTGIGISKENMKRLFNPNEFFTTYGTKDEKGTGLGLMLCKEFIEKNGGTIWVESQETKGTVFRFTLPKATIESE